MRWLLPLLVVLTPVAALMVSPVDAAGPPNALSNAAVTPQSGSPTTTFVFLVSYVGDYPANSVDALVAGTTVSLARISGTSTSGRWRGTHILPVGSWPVTFQADASQKNDPAIAGPTVVVTAPTPSPTPTPPPTPKPTATPRLTPTPVPTPAGSGPPASSTSGASSTPIGTSVSGLPVASSTSDGASASSAAGGGLGGGDDLDQQLGTILAGGLATIGLLAVVGFAAIWRDRRRREGDGPVLAPVQSAPMPAAEPRPRSEWERDYGLEDEPIGTIEYQPPGDKG
jgi:hypothetical protein